MILRCAPGEIDFDTILDHVHVRKFLECKLGCGAVLGHGIMEESLFSSVILYHFLSNRWDCPPNLFVLHFDCISKDKVEVGRISLPPFRVGVVQRIT